MSIFRLDFHPTRIAAIAGVLLATSLLAACGGGSASPQTLVTDSPVGPTASPPTPAAGDAGAASTPTVVASLPERYDPTRDAAADIVAAQTQAAGDHREVLLDFGADWCPDCVVLHRLLQSPAVQPVLREHYHLLAIDVGQFDRNLDVAGRYVDLDSSGIPALVVLTPAGRIRVTTNDGSFANARTMNAAQVRTFLLRWAAG